MSRSVSVALLLMLVLAGCTVAGSPQPTSVGDASSAPSGGLAAPSLPAPSPTATPVSTPDPAYVAGLRRKAQDELARWAAAVEKAGEGAVVLIGQLTGQVGQAEDAIAGDFKDALMCGLVDPAVALPAPTPPPGVVRWPGGASQTVRLISARQAVTDIRDAIRPECSDVRPLEISGARLGTVQVQTSRGPATAPAWQFSLRGTAVKVTRVAVADRVEIDPLAPNAMPALESARVSADGRELIVTFTGTPGTGDRPCGADYEAEAVESDLAVVVIVTSHRHPPSPAPPSGQPYACDLIGAERTASVTLASPLGRRTVLEVTQGTPVPVLGIA